MAEGKKQQLQGYGSGSIVFDVKSFLSIRKTRRTTRVFALGFAFAFVACTACIAISTSGAGASPWFGNLFVSPSAATTSSSSFLVAGATPYGSRISSIFSYFFPNSSLGGDRTALGRRNPAKGAGGGDIVGDPERNRTDRVSGLRNRTIAAAPSKDRDGNLAASSSRGKPVQLPEDQNGDSGRRGGGRRVGPPSNVTALHGEDEEEGGLGLAGNPTDEKKNQTIAIPAKDLTGNVVASRVEGVQLPENQNGDGSGGRRVGPPSNAGGNEAEGLHDPNSPPMKTNGSSAVAAAAGATKTKLGVSSDDENWLDSLVGCDLFHGRWVEDDAYPVYPEGSCPHIDESFDCYLNGRPDRAFLKLRWQPYGCNIPRLNATDMLERLRGKRLVFVGDSLNRNMWESLVCALRHSVVDKNKVFEMSGKSEFKTQGSYSFLFEDYGCTIEFFRTPFLVQEWEITDSHGKKKETLRLDMIEESSSKYKDASVLVFNTGHWWTHEKTALGKDYYQEGSHVYNELNVFDAFTKALRKWADWVDSNVDIKKTLVFFRGYSASHFSGGQWNSGGQCDDEVEPIRIDTHLSSYPPMMRILEGVLKEMKSPVTYLNVTRMTDYRKDAHPSIYFKPNLTEEERKSPGRFQDCSHWCLPGVPDSWNELLYAQLLIKQHLQQQQHQ